MKDEEIFANLARHDGRPEVYEVPDGFRGKCVICIHETNEGTAPEKPKGEIFMGSPLDFADGAAHLICKDHLPDNAVIYDPVTDKCRDKTGENEWEER